ncbi:hypothetical protein RBA41_31360 [Massilia sp. CCM 9210]|uniref:hypothetical protein n=1 Tax=Massilia scottii TaxID=3057166 RepID=UPI0027965B49|nr:hypothetical protein [Massilia sp. CCM 9210]MDQ1817809.1 hypothetical protein [Massilia sp. CCM 9210]
MELLQEKAPHILDECFWIYSWLRSQDHFLVELEKVVEVENEALRYHSNRPYPRPLPQRFEKDSFGGVKSNPSSS